jgi:hypothetical protein
LELDTIVLEEHTASIFRAEHGGSMFLWNADTHLHVHMVWQRRRPPSTSSLLWEPQISFYCLNCVLVKCTV